MQLELCAIVSLWRQSGTTFVHRISPSLDFHDFLTAASLWATGRNPYSDPRFVTPPFSLTVGIAGRHLAHSPALFLVVNILCICLATYLLAKTFHLSRSARLALLGSVLAFYPVYFLLERGNIDGLVLLLFAVSLCARNTLTRAAVLALANNLKLYTLLPSVFKAIRHRWREVGLLVTVTIAFAIPFGHWDRVFVHNLLTRATLTTGTENLSPAWILGSALKHWQVRLGYLLLWSVTLLLAVRKLSDLEDNRAAVWLTPWMVSIPFQVYPYSGILFIALLAEWISEAGIMESKARNIVVALGLCLVGVQQQALTEAFGWLVRSHRFFPFLNTLGVVLLAVSATMARSNDTQHRGIELSDESVQIAFTNSGAISGAIR